MPSRTLYQVFDILFKRASVCHSKSKVSYDLKLRNGRSRMPRFFFVCGISLFYKFAFGHSGEKQ